jgi:hypothetical protein
LKTKQQANLHNDMQREDEEKARQGVKQTPDAPAAAEETVQEEDLEQQQFMASLQAAADSLAEKTYMCVHLRGWHIGTAAQHA